MPSTMMAVAEPCEGVPPAQRPAGNRRRGPRDGHLPVADGAVHALGDDVIAANYPQPRDYAEGEPIIQTCEETIRDIRCQPQRLPCAQLAELSLIPPNQPAVEDLVQQQPTGTRGVVPGATNPERMEPGVVWEDMRRHFGQDTTAPQQLQEEGPVAQFRHESGQQFHDTLNATEADLPRRPHLNAQEFRAPLTRAKNAATPWLERWGSGYNSYSATGALILSPVTNCIERFDDTARTVYARVQAEVAGIDQAVRTLQSALNDSRELHELNRLAKNSQVLDSEPRLMELMDKCGFHDRVTVAQRFISEKKTKAQAVRDARRAKNDALEQARRVNLEAQDIMREIHVQLDAAKESARETARLQSAVYATKAKHMRDCQGRIKEKKAEMSRQKEAVASERGREAGKHVQVLEQYRIDTETKWAQVKYLLGEILKNEAEVRRATKADMQSAWKSKLLQAVLDENTQVLDGCFAEIADAPRKLDRCAADTVSMAETAVQLATAVAQHLNKDRERRECDGRNVDVEHFTEYTVARKETFRERLNLDVCKHDCNEQIIAAQNSMARAETFGHQRLYDESSQRHASLQQEEEAFAVVETQLQAEMDHLDDLIARPGGVVDRLRPLYTAGDLVYGAEEQKRRIEATDAKPPWGVATVRGAAEVQKILPGDELERQVRKEMTDLLSEVHQDRLRADQEASDRARQFRDEMMPQLENAHRSPCEQVLLEPEPSGGVGVAGGGGGGGGDEKAVQNVPLSSLARSVFAAATASRPEDDHQPAAGVAAATASANVDMYTSAGQQLERFSVGARVQVHSWCGGPSPQARLARNGQVGKVERLAGNGQMVQVRMENDQELLQVPVPNLTTNVTAHIVDQMCELVDGVLEQYQAFDDYFRPPTAASQGVLNIYPPGMAPIEVPWVPGMLTKDVKDAVYEATQIQQTQQRLMFQRADMTDVELKALDQATGGFLPLPPEVTAGATLKLVLGVYVGDAAPGA